MKLLLERWHQYLTEEKLLSEFNDLGSIVENILLEGKAERVKQATEKFKQVLGNALLKDPKIDWERLIGDVTAGMGGGKAMHSLRVGGMSGKVAGHPEKIDIHTKNTIIAALLHDYEERVGAEAIDKLVDDGIISPRARAIVSALSATTQEEEDYEKSGASEDFVLHHIKKVILDIDTNTGDPGTDNLAKILQGQLAQIKTADRVDNLNRRVTDPTRKGPLPVTKQHWQSKEYPFADAAGNMFDKKAWKKARKYALKSVDLINWLRAGGDGGFEGSPAKVDSQLQSADPLTKQALALAAAARGYSEIAQHLGGAASAAAA